ncbi:MAG: hypothetical protein INR65_19760, partial [Gluconacetobacter diazotrophicus]|nr:hypothetical protein [Gluconacetobacter diazotrophicus]
AEAVAAEWAAAGGGTVGAAFDAAELPLTQLASARQARVAPDRERVIAHLLGFLDGDALRYRAEPGTALRGKQDRLWDPWLDRAATRFGGTVSVVAGVMPADTDPVARLGAAAVLRAANDAVLAALAVLVPALNSLALGLAVAEGALDARIALELSLLDEHDQQARWGTVEEGEAREAALDRDVAAAARFLMLATAGAEAKARAGVG